MLFDIWWPHLLLFILLYGLKYSIDIWESTGSSLKCLQPPRQKPDEGCSLPVAYSRFWSFVHFHRVSNVHWMLEMGCWATLLDKISTPLIYRRDFWHVKFCSLVQLVTARNKHWWEGQILYLFATFPPNCLSYGDTSCPYGSFDPLLPSDTKKSRGKN